MHTEVHTEGIPKRYVNHLRYANMNELWTKDPSTTGEVFFVLQNFSGFVTRIESAFFQFSNIKGGYPGAAGAAGHPVGNKPETDQRQSSKKDTQKLHFCNQCIKLCINDSNIHFLCINKFVLYPKHELLRNMRCILCIIKTINTRSQDGRAHDFQTVTATCR